MFETVRLARWLAYCTLAVAFVAILAGCSGDSTAPGPTPTEAEPTQSAVTVSPPKPTAQPTTAATPRASTTVPVATPVPTAEPAPSPTEGESTEPTAAAEPTPIPTLVPTAQPTATAVPPGSTTVPVATPVPTAEPAPTPTQAAQAEPTPTPPPPCVAPPDLCEAGEAIPGFPTGKAHAGDFPNGVRAQFGLGSSFIEMSIGATAEYAHAIYTCAAIACRIENGVVTLGKVRLSEPDESQDKDPRERGPLAEACATEGAVLGAESYPGLVSDCAVLLAVRDTLAGSADLNWSASLNVVVWDGVTIGGPQRRVKRLDFHAGGGLPSYGVLTGTIPPELGALTSLQSLWLYGNQLTGTVPAELGALTNLERLGLGGTQLSGAIPPEVCALPNLRTVNVANSQLTGCEPRISQDANQPDLVEADSGSPESDRAALVALYNATGGANWPPTRRWYWLSDKDIEDWAGVTTSGGRVRFLTLSGLSGEIPLELFTLTGLKWLELSASTGSNKISGAMPPEIGNLSNLEVLRLTFRSDSTIPPELGRLTNLQELWLNGGGKDSQTPNGPTGTIPPELGRLSNLRELQINFHNLTGTIPPELGRLSNLRNLVLVGDGLAGAVPPELGNLDELRSLNLRSNNLTGTIPPELGRLAKLEWMRLDGNRLTGTIPPELGRLANLRDLSLNGNRLSGTIPAELGSLTRLERLYLSGNDLTGCIPPILRNVPSNDLAQNGLPYCVEEAAPPSPARSPLVPFTSPAGVEYVRGIDGSLKYAESVDGSVKCQGGRPAPRCR